MKCKLYDCEEETNGWPCCNATHGYIFNGDKGQLEKAISGVLEWNDSFYGIGRWTVEKYFYYLSLIQ